MVSLSLSLVIHTFFRCGSIVYWIIIIPADMFLVGTAMIMFGMGLYVIFVGKKTIKGKGPRLSGSNLFGLFPMKVII